MSEPHTVYGRLAAWVLGHGRLVVALTALITAVSLVVGLPPKVDSNLLKLLPDSDPTVAALHRINDEEGGLNILSLTYEAEDPEVLDDFLDELTEAFVAWDDVEFAMHELDPDLATHVGLLQFEADELAELNLRLQGALALGPALNPMVTQRLMDMGPLTERIAKANGVGGLTQEEGQGRLIVRPTESSTDPAYCIAFMARVDDLLERMDAESRGIRLLWMGGSYRHTREDVQGIQQDLLFTSVASGTMVLLVIMGAFRTWRSVVIVFPPLLVANAMNLAMVKVLYDSLNTYTSFGTAILLGLGIDFAIHLVGRYRELRTAGRSTEDALVAAWDLTGPPCATAALTSAAGFLALAAAEFKGFAQLGVLLATGLLFCLVAMLTLLPLLLRALDTADKPLLGTAAGPPEPSQSSYRYSPMGLMVAAVATVGIGAMAIPNLGFEYDMSALRRDGMSYAELDDEERKLAKASYSPIVVTYDDAGELAADQERIEDLLADDDLPHIRAAVSIRNVLPDDQAERNARIEELGALMEHRNLRYLPPQLVRRLLPLKGIEVDPLTRDDLPAGLLHILGARREGVNRMLLLPKGNMWDVREAQALADELDRVLPGREVAGEYLGIASMFLLALGDTPMVVGLALVFVFLLAWWDLRRALWAFGALWALVAGMTWASGALWVSGVKLTLINLTGVPILLGIGIDVVIHLLHRLQEEGPGGVRRALSTTGVAAGVSTLTTVLSFLSLTGAGNRGVRSMGLLVVIGLAVVFVVTAMVLPLAWSAGWKVAGRAPADQPGGQVVPGSAGRPVHGRRRGPAGEGADDGVASGDEADAGERAAEADPDDDDPPSTAA